MARGDKPFLRKSADRKAQIRKAFVQFSGLICALRSVDFSGKVYHPEPPHAQSLFLFPIVFGINTTCKLEALKIEEPDGLRERPSYHMHLTLHLWVGAKRFSDVSTHACLHLILLFKAHPHQDGCLATTLLLVLPHVLSSMHAPIHTHTHTHWRKCFQHIRTHTRSHTPKTPHQTALPTPNRFCY